MMNTVRRLGVVVVLSSVVACAACVDATNPFDPDTPAEEQAKARILGRLVLPGIDLSAAPRTLRLERDGVLEANLETRTTGDALPGTPRPDDGGAGTFDVEVVPGVVTLVYDAVADENPLFGSDRAELVLAPGADVGVLLSPALLPADATNGRIVGTVQGAVDGDSYAIVVERFEDGGIVAGGFQTAQLRSGNGSFAIANVPPGSYVVRAEGAGYVPTVATATAQIAGPGDVDVGVVGLTPLGAFFSLRAGDDEVLPFVRSDSVDVVVAPFVAPAGFSAEVLVAAADAFDGLVADDASWAAVPAGGNAVSVALDNSRDGENVIAAQLRLRHSGGAVFSAKQLLRVVRDTQAPTAIAVDVGGVDSGDLVLGCADFDADADCLDLVAANARAVDVDALLDDQGGRVVAVALAIDGGIDSSVVVDADGAVVRVAGLQTEQLDAVSATHTLTVSATDAAGNRAVVATRSIVVDVTPPATPSVTLSPALPLTNHGGGVGVIEQTALLALTGPDDAALWRVVDENGADLAFAAGSGARAFDPPLGATLALDSFAHRDPIAATVIVLDAAGNRAEADVAPAVAWRAGDVAVDVDVVADGDGVSAADATVTLTRGTEVLTGVRTGARVLFAEVPAGRYALRATAAGRVAVEAAVDVVASDELLVARAVLARARGSLTGSARFAEFDDDVSHGGIVVAAAVGGAVLATTSTLPDGSYRLDNLPATAGVTVTASAARRVPVSRAGVTVVADSVVTVPPLVLAGAADFALCELDVPLTFDPACAPISVTRATQLRLGIALETFDELRFSTTAFAADDAAPAFVAASAGVPVVDVVEGAVTVFVQLRNSGSGDTSEVKSASVTVDRTAPAGVRIASRFVAEDGARREGFVRSTAPHFVVDADDDDGTALAVAQVALDGGAAVDCALGASCAVAFAGVAVDGLHVARASVCDAAGNCSNAALAELRFVLDRQAPDVARGVSVRADVDADQLEGDVAVLATREHDAVVVAGTAQQDGPNGPVAEVVAVALSLDADDADALVDLDDDAPLGSAQNVTAPTFRGAAGPFSVFARFADAAGNESTLPLASSYAARFDNVPPFVTASLPSFTRACNGAVDLSVVDNNGEDFVRVLVDTPAGPVVRDVSAATALVPLALAPQASCDVVDAAAPDGDKNVSVVVVDRAGNQASLTRTVRVDRTPPAIVSATCATCEDGESTRVTTNSFDVVATDVTSNVVGVVRVDGACGAGDSCQSGFSCDTATDTCVQTAATPPGNAISIVLAAGAHSLGFAALDGAGNRSATAVVDVVVDGAAPSGTLTLNGGAAATNNRTLTAALTNLSDAESALSLAFAETALNCGTAAYAAIPNGATFTINASAGDGTKTVAACLRDAAGNTSSLLTDTIVVDTAAPAGVNVDVPAFVGAGSVNAALTFPGADTAAVAVGEGIDCGNATFVAPTATSTVTLSAGEGAKVIVACFRDAAQNVSRAQDIVVKDSVAPIATFALDAGAVFSTDTVVAVNRVDDADVATAAFVEGVVDCAAQPLSPYVRTAVVTVTLTGAADGARTVTGCFADAAGNLTATTDTITLDRQDPSGAVTVAGGAAFVRGIPGQPGAAVDADVAISGASADVVAMAVGVPSVNCATAAFAPFATLQRVSFTSDGATTVSVCLKDAAGRTATISDGISVDRVPPVGAVTLNGGAGTVTSLATTATFTVDADVVDVATRGADVDCEAVSAAEFVSLASLSPPLTRTIVLNAAGPQVATACFRDAAGNRFRAVDAIEVDLSALAQVILVANGGAAFARTAIVPLSVLAPSDAQTSKIVVDAANVDTNGDNVVDVCEGNVGYAAFVAAPNSPTLSDGPHALGVCVRTPTRTLFAETTITVDTVAPVGTLVIAPDAGGVGAARTRDAVNLVALTFPSDVDQIAVSTAAVLDCNTTGYEPATTSKVVTLPGPDTEATNTVRGCLKDRAGNVTAVADTIVFDRLAPAGTAQLLDLTSSPAPVAGFLHQRAATARLSFAADTARVAVAEGAIDCAVATYTAVTGTTADRTITVSLGDGAKVLSACFEDAIGNASSSSTVAQLDTANPVGTVAIANGDSTTRTRSVTVALSSQADVTQMSIAEAASLNCNTAVYEAFATNTVRTLSAGDATKTLSVCFKDAGGRTASASDTIVLDETRPSGTLALTGTGNAGFTTTRSVTATATRTDTETVEMAIATGTSLDCTNAPYVAFAPTSALTLSAGADGSRDAVLCLRDRAGNVSLAGITANITLDTTPPAGASIAFTAAATSSTAATVTATYASSGAGSAAAIAVAEGALDCATASRTALDGTSPDTLNLTLTSADGTKVAAACFFDAAGNVAVAVPASIVKDSAAPGVSSLSCPGCVADAGALFSTSTTVTLAFTTDEEGAGVASALTSVDGAADVARAVSNGTVTLTGLSAGARSIRVRLVDAAGNTTAVANAATVDVNVDNAAPNLAVGDVRINGAASGGFTNTRLVTLSVPAAPSDATGLAVVEAVSAPTCATATYLPFAANTTVELTNTQGLHTVFACLRDRAGNTSATARSATITLDTVAPSPVTVSVPTFSTTTTTTATLTFPAGDTTGVAVADGALDCALASYVTPTGSLSVTLSSGDGAHTVIACFKDAANNFSTTSDTVILDETNPAGTIIIDSGALFATSTTATATMTASADVVRMAVVESATAPSCAAQTFEAFATTKVVTLSAADGTKTLHLCLEDAAGRRFLADSDSIALDRTTPTGSVVINGGAAVTNDATLFLSITATSADVASMALAETALTCSTATYAAFQPTAVLAASSSDGTKTVVLCLKDTAGNTSAGSLTDSIVLDRTAPTDGDIDVVDQRSVSAVGDLTDDGIFNLNSASLLSGRLELNVTATAADSFVVVVDGPRSATLSGALPESGLVFPASPATLATSGADDGLYELFGFASDNAQNALTLTSVFVDYDTQAPCASGVLLLNNSTTPAPANSSVVAVTLACAESDEAPTLMQLGCDGDADDEPFVPFASTATCALQDGSRTVRANLFDDAGNERSPAARTITVDRVPPSVPRFADSADITSSTTLTVAALASPSTDNVGGAGLRAVAPYDVLIPAVAPGAACPAELGGVASDEGFCSWDGTTTFLAALLEGENRLKVTAVDQAGNRSDDDQLVVVRDDDVPDAPVITRLAVIGTSVQLEFNIPGINTDSQEADAVDHYEVFYGSSDAAIAGTNRGGDFLENGPSPIDVGLDNVVRLLGAPDGLPLFVTVRAVDSAGNASNKAVITAVDVVQNGAEVLANVDADRFGVFRAHDIDAFGSLFVVPTAVGFEVYKDFGDTAAPKRQAAVTFPLGVGLTPALHGVVFGGPLPADASCSGTPTEEVFAAVIAKGRGDQGRFGDVLVFDLGNDCELFANGVQNPRLVESHAVLGEPVDLQVATRPDGTPRLAWLESVRGASISGADLVVADVGTGNSARRTSSRFDNTNPALAEFALQLPVGSSAVMQDVPAVSGAEPFFRTDTLAFALLDEGSAAVVVGVIDGDDSEPARELIVGARLDINAAGLFTPSPTATARRHKARVLRPSPDPIDATANPTNRYDLRLGRGEPVVVAAGGARSAWWTVTPQAASVAPQCARRLTLDDVDAQSGFSFDNVGVGFVAGGDNTTFPALETRTSGDVCRRAGKVGVGPFPASIGVIERRDQGTPKLIALARDVNVDADGIGSRVATFSVAGAAFSSFAALAQANRLDDETLDGSPLPAPPHSTWTVTEVAGELHVVRGASMLNRGDVLIDRVSSAGAIVSGASVPFPGRVVDSLVADGTLYLAHERSVVAYDLANPAAPRFVSPARDSGGAPALLSPTGLARYGHLLYVSSLDDVRAFDISDPSLFREVSISAPAQARGSAMAFSAGGIDAINGNGNQGGSGNLGQLVQTSAAAVFLQCSAGPTSVDCDTSGVVQLVRCEVNTGPVGFGDLSCSQQATIEDTGSATNLQIVDTSVFVLVNSGVRALHQRSLADLNWVDRCLPRDGVDLDNDKTPDLCDPDASASFDNGLRTDVTAYDTEGSTLFVVLDDGSERRLVTYEVAPRGMSSFGPGIQQLQANTQSTTGTLFELELSRLALDTNDAPFHDIILDAGRTISVVSGAGGVAFVGPVVVDPTDNLEVPAMVAVGLGARRNGTAAQSIAEPAQVLTRLRFAVDRIDTFGGGFVAVNEFQGATVFVGSRSTELAQRFSAPLQGTETTRGTLSRRVDADKALRVGTRVVAASLDPAFAQPRVLQCRVPGGCDTNVANPPFEFVDVFGNAQGVNTVAGQVSLLDMVDGQPTIVAAFPDKLERTAGPVPNGFGFDDDDLHLTWVLDIAADPDGDRVAVLVEHIFVPDGFYPNPTFLPGRREVIVLSTAVPLLGRHDGDNSNSPRDAVNLFDWGAFRVRSDPAFHGTSIVGHLAINQTGLLGVASDVQPRRLAFDGDRIVLFDDGQDGDAAVVSLPVHETACSAVTTAALVLPVPICPRAVDTAALVALPGAATLPGTDVVQAHVSGGVLTQVSAGAVRHNRVSDLAGVRLGEEISFSGFAADPGVPMLVRGNAVFVAGSGKLFPLTRQPSVTNNGAPIEFFSPLKAAVFTDERVAASIVVNVGGVTGAFARASLMNVAFTERDTTGISEGASFASGLDPGDRGGALVDVPWGLLYFDRGNALRVLTASE